jgi:hypothetical protein
MVAIVFGQFDFGFEDRMMLSFQLTHQEVVKEEELKKTY